MNPDIAITDREVVLGFQNAVSCLAEATGDTEANILIKSLGLMVIALRARRQGKIVVVTTSSAEATETAERPAVEITGFW